MKADPYDLPAHPAAELFQLLPDDELRAMAEDIKKKGLDQPIVLHEGKVLDGRNRLAACKLAGVEPRFVDWDGKGTPLDYVVSANLHRRHLTAEQRRKVIEAVLEDDPQQSNRRAAAKVGADHKTVGTVREEMERRGEIPHVETRQDTKGRQQSSTKYTDTMRRAADTRRRTAREQQRQAFDEVLKREKASRPCKEIRSDLEHVLEGFKNFERDTLKKYGNYAQAFADLAGHTVTLRRLAEEVEGEIVGIAALADALWAAAEEDRPDNLRPVRGSPAEEVTRLQARIKEATGKIVKLIVAARKQLRNSHTKSHIDLPLGMARCLVEALARGDRLDELHYEPMFDPEFGGTLDEYTLTCSSALDLQATLDTWYREVAKQHHPDRGGSHEVMAAINDLRARLVKLFKAKEQAQKEAKERAQPAARPQENGHATIT
jgi:molybdenum-dependent DNA-binding transcriptional regulator ModE